MTHLKGQTASFTEVLVRRHRLYRGCVDFCVDEVSLPNGRRAKRQYLDHPGAAAVVPFVDDRRVVLVRQYRYPIGEETLEIPAGKLDDGESPRLCVRRELAEETGFRARVLKEVLSFHPTPAFANEIIHVFAARDLRAGPHKRDADEFLSTEIMPFRQALRLVKTGKIKDSKTVIGLLACALWSPFKLYQNDS